MGSFSRIAAIFCVAGCLASNAEANDLRPLVDLPDAEQSYRFVRCAGLWSAILTWTGSDVAGEHVTRATEESVGTLNLAALLHRFKSSGADVDLLTAHILRDGANISDLYLKKFEANYASMGEAFGSDPLVHSDLAACQIVHAEAAGLVEALEDQLAAPE